MAGALAVTAFGLSVPAASAGEPSQIRTHGGTVSFDDLGNLLVAKDERRDGLGVRAYLHWRGGRAAATDDSGASGTGETLDVSVREGTTVWLQMCYIVHNVGDVRCSRLRRAEA